MLGLRRRFKFGRETVFDKFEKNYKYSVDMAVLQGKLAEKRPWIRCSGFYKALEERDQNAIISLLDSGFDIDTYLMYRKTSICFCVLNEWYDMAELLVRRGCSLSLKTESGETPLHMAVLKSNYRLVKLLIEFRADVTSVDTLHKTALHFACQMNNLSISTLLIENMTPAMINAIDKDKRTALFYACQFGSADLISTLISKGAKVNLLDSHGNNPLLHAMVNPQCTTDVVNLMLDAGTNINHSNASNETALLIATRMCSIKSTYPAFLDICLLLIERGSDVNDKIYLKEPLLKQAISLRDETLTHKLLNYGCDPSSIGKDPLFYSCMKGREKTARLFFDSGVDARSFCRYNFKRRIRQAHPNDRTDYTLVLRMQEEFRKLPPLSNICRTIIRKQLPRNIEKSSSLLPLPQSLIRFIQLY